MKTKYYIEYPIPIRCGLKCAYCFHAEKWELEREGRADEKYTEKCPFTPQEFIAWRDKFIPSDDYLYELQGGEMSCCADEVFEIIDTLDKGKFQLQTNGLGDMKFYRELIKRKEKIDRVGFTFHRVPINGDAEKIKRFEYNVEIVRNAGIQVYVKELLMPEHKAAILDNKAHWATMGVDFRIQDFKGYRGRGVVEYTLDDVSLVTPEYRHLDKTCHCREGRRQVLIRGYDIFAGDVLACWNDPCVVGNIVDGWYSGYAKVNSVVRENGAEDRDVSVSGEKIYRGTYPRDIWTPENEKQYGNLNKQQLKSKKEKQNMTVQERQKNLTDAQAANNGHIAKLQDELNQRLVLRERIAGALEVLADLVREETGATPETIAADVNADGESKEEGA